MQNVFDKRKTLLTGTALTLLVSLSPGLAFGSIAPPVGSQGGGSQNLQTLGSSDQVQSSGSGGVVLSPREDDEGGDPPSVALIAEDTDALSGDGEEVKEDGSTSAALITEGTDTLGTKSASSSSEETQEVSSPAQRVQGGGLSPEGNNTIGSPKSRVTLAAFSLSTGQEDRRESGVRTKDMTSEVAEGKVLSFETIDAAGTVTVKGKGTTETRSGLKAAQIVAATANEGIVQIKGAIATNTEMGDVGSSDRKLKGFSITGGFENKTPEQFEALSSDKEKEKYKNESAPVKIGAVHAQNIGFGVNQAPQEDGDSSTYIKQKYDVDMLDAGHTSKLNAAKGKTVDDEETGNITIGNAVDLTVRGDIIADNILGTTEPKGPVLGEVGSSAPTSHLIIAEADADLDANIGRAVYDAQGDLTGYERRISRMTVSEGANVRLTKGRHIATGDGFSIEHGATFRTSEQNKIDGSIQNHGNLVFNTGYSGDGETSVDELTSHAGSEIRIEGPVHIQRLHFEGDGKNKIATLTFADPASGYVQAMENDGHLPDSTGKARSGLPDSESYAVRVGSVESVNGGKVAVAVDQTFIHGTFDNAIALENPLTSDPRNIVFSHDNFLADIEVFDRSEKIKGLAKDHYYSIRATAKSAEAVASLLDVNRTEAAGLLAAVQSIGNDHELRSAFKRILDEAESNTASAAASAKQVSATTTSQAAKTMQSLSHAASNAVSDRLASARGGGTVAGLEETGVASGNSGWRNGFWSRASGSLSKQKSRNGAAGNDTKSYGLTIGLDNQVTDTSRAGAALSYSSSSMDGKGVDRSQTDVESYQIALYGSYEPDSYFVEGQIAFAHNDVNTSRKINFGGLNRTASGKYDAAQYSATIAAGLPVHAGTVTITPKGGLFYSYTDPSQYTEKGAGGLNMVIDPASTHILEANLGASVGYEHQNLDGSLIAPEFRAAALYEFLGDEGNATAKYSGSGATFKTQGLDPSKLGGTIGTGIGYTTADGAWEVRADYDAEFRSGYVGHNGMLTGRLNF